MPFWKHRYEMYSAWVFTCIAESVSDLGLSYNVLGGVLQFKFSGALLARVNIPDVEFEIWAEKRYEAENLVGEGRKKHIQPDYSIMKRCNGAGEACLLIECKQYKKSNSRNFAIAVNDYARSRPDANVLLVNYGPISRNLSMRIGSDVRRRYRGYEKMKPLTARRAEFVRDVRDMIDACWADIQFSAGRDLILWEEKPEQLKVELSWNQLPTDLDLSVFFRMPSEKEDCHVYFGHRGLEDGYPFACLDADVRNGPGKETIIIKKIVSGGYDIEVSNYSGEERIDGEIVIRISAGRQFVEEVKRGFWKETSAL